MFPAVVELSLLNCSCALDGWRGDGRDGLTLVGAVTAARGLSLTIPRVVPPLSTRASRGQERK